MNSISAAIGGFVVYSTKKSEANSGYDNYDDNRFIGPYRRSKSDDDEATAGLVVGIGFSIVTLISVALIYYVREKIAVAIALIKEGSK